MTLVEEGLDSVRRAMAARDSGDLATTLEHLRAAIPKFEVGGDSSRALEAQYACAEILFHQQKPSEAVFELRQIAFLLSAPLAPAGEAFARRCVDLLGTISMRLAEVPGLNGLVAITLLVTADFLDLVQDHPKAAEARRVAEQIDPSIPQEILRPLGADQPEPPESPAVSESVEDVVAGIAERTFAMVVGMIGYPDVEQVRRDVLSPKLQLSRSEAHLVLRGIDLARTEGVDKIAPRLVEFSLDAALQTRERGEGHWSRINEDAAAKGSAVRWLDDLAVALLFHRIGAQAPRSLSAGIAAELGRLADIHRQKLLTNAEFEAAKAAVLGDSDG